MSGTRTRPSASVEAALVARKYYLGRMQKSEIAEELGLSRFKIARLLDEAVAAGIVHITVDMPTELDLDLGDRVAARFGIRAVIAARTIDDDPDAVAAVVGAAAADFLAGIIDSADVVGISWGRTLAATVEAFTKRSGNDVVQLVGGVTSGTADVGGVELVRRLSTVTGGSAFPLHSPLLVGTAAIAEQLRGDPSVSATSARFKDLTIALMGIGSWAPPSSMVYNGATPTEREELRALHAATDLCGIVFDEQGQEISSVLQGRRIGITSAQLATVPTKVAVAGGEAKAAAIGAALRTQRVDVLVTDTSTARQLLALAVAAQ